jgi:hypothetical protein
VKKFVALASLLVLGTSVSAAAPTGSAPAFEPARNYTTGRNPLSVAIGDLNGDRKPDLATANYGTEEHAGETVSVLLNTGDGRFRPRLDYATGSRPWSVAIGDLNGDGKLDLATANTYPSDSVSVLLNKGDGSFQAKVDYATGRGSPYSVAIGDLNGDGKPDLATANTYAGTVSVLLNRGDGSFQAKVDYAIGAQPAAVAIGDLNGDGKPDLATANYPAKFVSVLLNSGDGSFPAKRDYRTSLRPTSVTIGDLNGDGTPDLVTATGSPDADPRRWINAVTVLLNSGDSSFRATRVYRTGLGPRSVAIDDLNGDGKPDLATANYGRTISVLVNRGDGSFRAKRDFRTGGGPFSVAIGDLNGDGKADLATANIYPSDSVSVLINTPGLCTVQDVIGLKLAVAKRTLGRVNCRVGKVTRAYKKSVKKHRVISEKPKPGTVLLGGGKVNLVVSRGRKH